MRTKLIAILVANLFAGGAAMAADGPFIWQGSVSLGGIGANVDGNTRNGARATSALATAPFAGPADEAKASEYRDLTDGAISIFDIRGSNGMYWLGAFGENLGRDDQQIDLRGGSFGAWKAQLLFADMPHNYSWNALTPLSNPGGVRQTLTGSYPPAQDPSTWNKFDYGVQRKTQGANVEVSLNSPWFVRADYSETKMSGIRPSSAQLGTGSSNGLIEFGMPIDSKTQNTTIEAGYTAKTWNVKVGFLDSKFHSAIDQVVWSNPFIQNALDISLAPPDNELKKWSINASVRELPLDSALTLRYTQSELKNSFAVSGYGLKPTSNAAPTNGAGYLYTAPSSSTFDGNHKTTTASVALTSTPIAKLDVRAFYNYYDKDNRSTEISYAAGGLGPTAASCGSNSATRFCIAATPAGELLSYTKDEYGIDLAYRITSKHKVSGGYHNLKVDRTLESAPSTETKTLWAEYKGRFLSSLSGKVKYEYLERRSDLENTAALTSVNRYYTAYDVSNSDVNRVKASVDWSPMDNLSVLLGGSWAKTDYKDLYYGRTDDKRSAYDLTVTFGNPDAFHITAIGNWSEVEFNQAYRTVASGQSPLPGGTQTATTFDWGTKNTQGSWLVGLQADWPVNDKLGLMASVSYGETDGGVDFWSGNQAGAGGFLGGPLVNYVTDNTKMTRAQLKANYKINKNWSATAGYAYEKYQYADDQLRSYQSYYPYYQNLGGTNNSWYSGAFASPGYTANIFYLYGTYKFD